MKGLDEKNRTDEWKYVQSFLNPQEFKELVKTMIETTEYEIPLEYITKNIDRKRYYFLRKRKLPERIENKEYLSPFMIELFKSDVELYESTKQKIREKYKTTDWYKEIIENTENDEYDGDLELYRTCYLFLPDLSDIIVTGDFNCSYNNLISLEGCPKKVGRDFWCSNNYLTSLEGCPEKVGRDFWCSNTKLTSLEGSPKEIRGSFVCYNNSKLTSLEGSPKEIRGSFICYNNSKLTSLEGSPKKVGGNFDCSNNKLTSLEGCPAEIGRTFITDNKFTEDDKQTAMENRRNKIEQERTQTESFKQFFYRYNK